MQLTAIDNVFDGDEHLEASIDGAPQALERAVDEVFPAQASRLCLRHPQDRKWLAGLARQRNLTIELASAHEQSITPVDREREAPDQGHVVVACGPHCWGTEEPLTLLKRLRPAADAVVAILPHAGHGAIVHGLIAGEWIGNRSAGERDGIAGRFFTRREVEKLFFRAGWKIEALVESRSSTNPPGLPPVAQHLQAQGAGDLDVTHFVVRARPAPTAEVGLTSIVILTHNQWSYTHQCLESIRACTDEPYELIVVDNASTDGTREYLRACADVRLIENAENRGFPAAANQGIRAARGEQILLLNNDTLVTTGWLERLLAALHRDSDVGLVGPCSNYVSGPQQVEIGYDQLAALDGAAWEWRKRHFGKCEATERLVGFCLLMRRSVMERIGLLDERFGVGNFEDDDFSRRARVAGFRCLIARDAFVHHFGHRTFQAAGIDCQALMDQNQRLFEEKWRAHPSPAESQAPLDAAPDVPPRWEVRMHPGGGLELVAGRPKLSLCMIVRDNERTLDAALASIKPWVDEMVVVDTGSTDRTPQIALRHGARVFHFPWCDDFAAARNESLRPARGEWLFWMDSDDVISADCGQKLQALAAGAHAADTLGYVMQVHCPGSGDEARHDVTVVDHVKLFRNRPELRFEGRIHEQILPAIRRAGGEVEWIDLHVVHAGSDQSPAGRRRKQLRDLRILEVDLAERPEHPFVLFNLGMTYADMEDYPRGAEYLRRSIAASEPDESHLRKAHALLIGCLTQQGDWSAAEDACRRALAQFAEDPELRFRWGIIQHQLGELDEAAAAYRAVLQPARGRHFSSIDRGIVGFKARHNLALVLEDAGDLAAAAEQ